MNRQEMGKRLEAIRKERGQSKAHVSRMTGCSYSAICSYEAGRRSPSDDVKVKLADHFGVSVGSLFYCDR